MTWANPVFLFWGLLALTPVLLHFFMNRKPVVDQILPTFRFLSFARVEAVRQKKIQEWLILLLRVLLLLLFSWILARPLSRPQLSLQADKIAFLLDDSLSASYENHGISSFQRQTQQAIQLLETIPQAVPIAVYFTSREFVNFTLDRQSLKQQILKKRSLSHSFSCASIVEDILHTFGKEKGELILFTDRTKRALEGVAPNKKLRLVDCGFNKAKSSTITSLTIGNVRQLGQKVDFTFTGKFNSSQAFLKINGKVVKSLKIEPPYQSEYKFDFIPNKPGPYTVEIYLAKDPLEKDHHRYGAFYIGSEARVLVVGEPAVRTFLTLAFRAINCEVTGISPKDLGEKRAEEIDLLCVVDSSQYQEREIDILKGYLSQKIPLIYYPGTQKEDLKLASHFFAFKVKKEEKDVFSFNFQSKLFPEDLLVFTKVKKFFPVQKEKNPLHSLLSLQDGRTLIAKRNNRIWVGFPLVSENEKILYSPLFPIIQFQLMDLLLKQPFEETGKVGTPHPLHWDKITGNQSKVILPNGKKLWLRKGRNLDETWQLGHYYLYQDEKKYQLLCINPETEEFELSTFSLTELKKRFGEDVFYIHYLSSTQETREWAYLLAYLSCFLLVLETYWSNKLYQRA